MFHKSGAHISMQWEAQSVIKQASSLDSKSCIARLIGTLRPALRLGVTARLCLL